MSEQLLSPDSRKFISSAFGVEFTVYGKAAPAGSKRMVPHRTTGKMMILDDSKRTGPWKKEVREVASILMRSRPPFLGPVLLDVVFFEERPKGHWGARGLKPSAPKVPCKKPDVTKLIRALEDALTGIVWKDDVQVVEQHAYKRYGSPPRAEVKVIAIP